MDPAPSRTAPSTDDRQVVTVSQLTAQIKRVLEGTFPLVWVSGELSDVARPQSGHLYLTLKDAHAQIRGVMWRSAVASLKFTPQDGQEVVCLASVEVYPPRGSYQLVIRRLEPLGLGALQLALRQLQEKLAREGLFAAEHKKPLPRFPRQIGLITSPTGAAVRDFLEVIRRRWAGARVLVFPAKVQGAGAAPDIVRAIQRANQLRTPPDVLVVTRGGGSLEDLWCFNEEAVVRAIFASQVPVVSAIGHEIDVTLSDLVADLRALTPSEAAERVAPSQQAVTQELWHFEQRLRKAAERRLEEARSRLQWLAGRPVLKRPFDLLHQRARRIDELQLRLTRAATRYRQHARRRLEHLAARLESLSPLAVLRRGYSVTRRPDGTVVRAATDVQTGDIILTQLARGRLTSRIETQTDGQWEPPP